MTITIDKHVPIPDRRGAARNKKYPFDLMEVGDSFFVPGRSATNFGSTASAAGRRTGYRFVVREVEEGGEEGVRVWRAPVEPVSEAQPEPAADTEE